MATLEGVTILLHDHEIEKHIKQLVVSARQHVTTDDIAIVGILDGAIHFASDFARHWSMTHECNPWLGLVRVQSYSEGEQGPVLIHSMRTPNVIPDDRPVVLVDTCVDTGATLEAVCKHIPNVVLACALVVKEEKMATTPHLIPVPVLCSWYVKGDPWLVGYGLDHDNGRYRALPYLASVEPGLQATDKV